MPACACRHRRRRATFCTTTAFCWRHNNLVTTTSSQRPRRDHSMRVSSLSRPHFYAPTQAWRRRWRRATYSTTFFCAGVTTTSSQRPRHNDHVTTTSESRAASYANSTTHKSMYSRLRPNAMAATTARPTHLACLTAHACMPATTNNHVLGQWRDGWAGQEWGMPPRCLEKGQLSSRIMREVLQSGGRAGDGRTCREGGMWGEHAGGAISRTTWPHASKARGYITPGGRRPDPTQAALPCAHHTHASACGMAAWRCRRGAHSLWLPPRAHTARRVFCTLGATSH